jgi:ADP-glucose pyrophosphorylase
MVDGLSSTTRATQATYAMVLAGGRGSRLGQLTDNRAKPAAPFGGKFRLIDFAPSNCVNSGIRPIGVATQYKAQSLIQHLKCGWSFLDGRFGECVDVLPAQQRLEDHWYRGTADAVYQNLDLLRRSGPELVLVWRVITSNKMDYGRLIEAHLNRSADMTVACLETSIREARAFGVMGIDEDWGIRDNGLCNRDRKHMVMASAMELLAGAGSRTQIATLTDLRRGSGIVRTPPASGSSADARFGRTPHLQASPSNACFPPDSGPSRAA